MTKKNVYLIEDNELLQKIFTQYVKLTGHTVIGQSNGKEFYTTVENIRLLQPDIIFADIHLGYDIQHTGIDILEEVHKTNPIPSVIISGMELTPNDTKGRISSYMKTLLKPVHMDDVKKILESF